MIHNPEVRIAKMIKTICALTGTRYPLFTKLRLHKSAARAILCASRYGPVWR